jgi:hypothetical protein
VSSLLAAFHVHHHTGELDQDLSLGEGEVGVLGGIMEGDDDVLDL